MIITQVACPAQLENASRTLIMAMILFLQSSWVHRLMRRDFAELRGSMEAGESEQAGIELVRKL